jgi:hypothetical protein
MTPRMTPISTFARKLLAACLVAILAGGCAEFPIFDKTPSRNATHPKAAASAERDAPARPRERSRERDDAARDAAALREGIRLYNEGDYNGAIKQLTARELNNAPVPARVTALKYTAFSYCVTARPVFCRQSFDKALRLDAGFDLAPGEHGHPLWGPVFTQAKQAAKAR